MFHRKPVFHLELLPHLASSGVWISTSVKLGKLSISELKTAIAEEPVDAKTQSSKEGIATGGTCLKLVESDDAKETISLIPIELVFHSRKRRKQLSPSEFLTGLVRFC